MAVSPYIPTRLRAPTAAAPVTLMTQRTIGPDAGAHLSLQRVGIGVEVVQAAAGVRVVAKG